jgi:hypothetical protein
MRTQQTTAELEYDYLKWNGGISFLGGILILFCALAKILDLYRGTFGLLIFVVLGIMFVVIVLLAAWKLQGNFSLSKQSWLSTFEDEFLNMVSLKAYKFGFLTVTLACIPGGFGAYNLIPLSREDLFTCLLGIGAVSFGITIVVGLRKDYD